MEGSGRNAIVTGASRGIGRGIAFELAKRSYNLFITHLDEADEANEVATRVAKEYGVRCEVAQADLRREDTPVQIVEQAVSAYDNIHLLVNNAGISLFDDIAELPLERLNNVLHLNFRAPMLATRTVAAHMIERGIAGCIINIASSRAERAYPGDAVYGGMKAALVRSVQSAALDLAPHGIRVNAVSPGAIQVRDTPQVSEHYMKLGARIPLGRAGTPADIGKAVAWLGSDDASYITGINLRVDGGLILPGMPERMNPIPADGWGKPTR